MKHNILLFLILLTGTISGQSISKESYLLAHKHHIYSKVLQEEREIFIHKPQGFWGMDENLEQYAVIFVLDGESQFLNTVSTVDYLSAAPMGNDLMPRSIVVGIPNTNRNRDLTPYPGMMGLDSTSIGQTGGGPDFLEFITSELIPYIDKNYATSKHRTIIGHSLGGLLVCQALLEKHDFFDHYLAIDPALSFDQGSYLRQVIDSFRITDLSDERLFFSWANSLPSMVDVDSMGDDNSEIVQLTKSNYKFVQLADSENWEIHLRHQYYADEDHFSVPFRSVYDAMKYFYSYYPFKEIMDYYHPSLSHKTDLVSRLQVHYKHISKRIGYEVKPMISYINSWAYGMSHFDRPGLAIALFDYGITSYPDEPAAINNKAYYYQNNGKMEAAIELFERSLGLEYDDDIASWVRENIF